MLEKVAKKMAGRKRGKFSKVMREFSKGKLHHGSTGDVVTDVNVAKAIAASEAGISRGKKKRGR